MKLEEKLEVLEKDKELEMLRAVQEERLRWENREERLLRCIEGTEPTAGTRRHQERGSATVDTDPLTSPEPPETSPLETGDTVSGHGSLGDSPGKESSVGVSTEPHHPPGSLVTSYYNLQSFVPHQLPPLASFKGEIGPDHETIQEWLERFSMLAGECKWTPRAKLLHLTSRLEKQAYAFYRSCPSQVRNSYENLAKELTKRFTPVRIQGVDTSLFHERRQKAEESVDSYAQELRRLYQKAYPESLQGSEDAEKIGKTLLASQFLSGLRTEIKRRVTGSEHSHDLEQLLVKARFEEAKIAELATTETNKPMKGIEINASMSRPNNSMQRVRFQSPSSNQAGPSGSRSLPLSAIGPRDNPRNFQRGTLTCHNCGGRGHFARDCRWRGPRNNTEVRPRPTHPNPRMSALTGDMHEEDHPVHVPAEDKVAQLRCQLRRAELEEALQETRTMLLGISSPDCTENAKLGPTVLTGIELEGVPVQALVDTGSPATIVSLELLLEVLWRARPTRQSREEWEKEVKGRIETPTLTLQNYGGERINTVGQISISLSRDEFSDKCLVQVQRHSPVPILLGTDVQSKLGFMLLQDSTKGRAVDLLSKKDVQSPRAVENPKRPATTHLDPATMSKDQSTCVHLISQVRIPSRHSRLVEASVTSGSGSTPIYFESAVEELAQHGLVIDDGLVKTSSEGVLVLPIQNHSLVPVNLRGDQLLGRMKPEVALIPTREDNSSNLIWFALTHQKRTELKRLWKYWG